MKVTTKRRIIAATVLLGAVSSISINIADAIINPNRDLFNSPSEMAPITSKIKEATIYLSCEPRGDEYEYSGSAWQLVIEGERYLITNAHVIEDCIDVGGIYAYDWKFRPLPTQLLGFRHEDNFSGVWDIAVLEGVDTGVPLELASTDPVAGHWIIAAGWPGIHSETYQAVTSGHVTGITSRGVIVHDAQLHSGMSGGPILNARGQVVGVNYAGTSEKTVRSLGQPLRNLCKVVFDCDDTQKPLRPITFPTDPIKEYERND